MRSDTAVESEWRDAYAEPVVRASSVHSTKFHRPDPDAAEPVPACVVPNGTKGYVVKERAFAERAREPCPSCFGDD